MIKVYRGRDRAFMLPTDEITRYDPMPSLVQRLQFLGQFHQDFLNLKKSGLLPAGAKEPPVLFPRSGIGGSTGVARGTGIRSYETGGKVYISPEEVKLATNPNLGPGSLHAWARQVPIHELAHTLQSQQTLSTIPAREGGAQAFTDAAVPAVVGPLPSIDTNYSGYVRQARRRGPAWFMRGQFQGPGAKG